MKKNWLVVKYKIEAKNLHYTRDGYTNVFRVFEPAPKKLETRKFQTIYAYLMH